MLPPPQRCTSSPPLISPLSSCELFLPLTESGGRFYACLTSSLPLSDPLIPLCGSFSRFSPSTTLSYHRNLPGNAEEMERIQMPNFFQIIKDDRVLNADHVIRYHSDEEDQIHSLASVAQEFRSDYTRTPHEFSKQVSAK